MNCGRVSNQLSAYLDRELTGTEMLQIRSHLGDCDRCRDEYEALGRIKMMLGRLRSTEPSAGFVAATMRRFESAAPRPRTPQGSGPPALLAAARRFFRPVLAAPPPLSPATRRPRAVQRLLGLLPWQPLTLGITTMALVAALLFTSLVLYRPHHADETVATKPPLVIEGMDPEAQELSGSRGGADWAPGEPSFRPIFRDRLSSGYASPPWVAVSLQGENSWPFR